LVLPVAELPVCIYVTPGLGTSQFVKQC